MTTRKKPPAFKFVERLPKLKSSGRHSDPVYSEFAEALRNNPGQWAQWPKPIAKTTAGALVSRINQCADAPASLSTGEFEAASRVGVLYVRFVGKPSKRRGVK